MGKFLHNSNFGIGSFGSDCSFVLDGLFEHLLGGLIGRTVEIETVNGLTEGVIETYHCTYPRSDEATPNGPTFVVNEWDHEATESSGKRVIIPLTDVLRVYVVHPRRNS